MSLLPSSISNDFKESTLFSDTRICGEFFVMAINNEASYVEAAAVEEKELTANFACKTTELLCHKNLSKLYCGSSGRRERTYSKFCSGNN